MKKSVCLIITVFIILSLVACGSSSKNSSDKEETKYHIGDYVTFGRYDVDGKKQNGIENIEWLILDEKDGNFLFISKDIIFTERYISTQQYNRNEWAKWDNSNIRKKMNVDFYGEAFDENEKNMIVVTNVLPDKNPYYGINPGTPTEDKLFLLSLDEVEKYFPKEKDRVCSIAKSIDSDTYSSDWCTRTPGQSDANVVAVTSKDGSIIHDGYYTLNYFGIRPAMWVNSELLEEYEPADILPGGTEGKTPSPAAITICDVGDFITFGEYEQDNKADRVKEEIEWLVLDIQDEKALVISSCALDCQQYNTEYTDVTWETCSLRKWLNSDFFDNAFSEDEKALICATTVLTYDSQNDTEFSTEDNIFLLSLDECEKYASQNSGCDICEATNYAKSQGDLVIDEDKASWWYRTSGDEQNKALRFWCEKRITSGYKSYDVDSYGGIRPAMWIQLSR